MSAVDKAGPNDDTRVSRVLAGRYRLLRLIGHGGMGSVYEAVHVHTDKRVAIKLLSNSLSRDLKLVARFRREAMAASRLEHENCVHVDDFGEDADGTFYISMEIVDGHGLADELRKSGPMPWDRVARLAAQLLKALDVAHAAGVLHRDLKPQNVMIAQKPSKPDIVKVVDFGIAKITTNSAEDQGALTVPGTIFGTPEYMSPEQARGEVLDARSDIYSASVVLWHMMLGRSPFRGSSVRETLMKVFADEPPSPSAERPTAGIPASFEAVLRKGMSKQKEDRWPDAASYLDALRPFLTDGVEIPRRPEPGLARDGGAPPSTIDDNPHRSATLAIPEADLAPLDTRFGALPDGLTAVLPAVAPAALPVAPSDAQRKTKLVSASDVRELHAPPPAGQPAEATEASGAAPRKRARGRVLSPAAAIVLGIAAVGVVGILAGAYVLLQPAERPRRIPERPVDLTPRDKPTTKDQQEKHDELAQELLEVAPDPVARDAALFRAERAMEQGDSQTAVGAYNEAINADPTSAKAHLGRATVAMGMRDWATARDHFERAMALDSEYAKKLAGMHARAKKLAEQP